MAAYFVVLLGIPLVALYLLSCLRLLIRGPLRQLPGPLWTKISGISRLYLVASGKAPDNYRRLHKRYGDIVRTAPNQVSIADPAAVNVIYGLGTNFYKVRRNRQMKMGAYD